jgi:hypothetical protein
MSDKPTFTTACLKTLDDCRAIVDQRSGEYSDSWALKNMQSPFLDNILKGLGFQPSTEQKRLMIMAAMCDVKISRLVGPFKTDTIQDLICYAGALASLHADSVAYTEEQVEVLKGLKQPGVTSLPPCGGPGPKSCKMPYCPKCF